MIALKNVKFIYNKPALILKSKSNYLVVGDLHIGNEKNLIDRGIHIYDITDSIKDDILNIAKSNNCKRLILLGDIKDEILHMGYFNKLKLNEFFSSLNDVMDITIIKGNHDAFIEDILNIKVDAKDEFLLPKIALLHGNKFPSDEAMKRELIITAHNHIAIYLNSNNSFYKEKAWLISDIDEENSKKFYKNPKAKKLIIMPAFNPMIIGKAVNDLDDKNINPLIRNNIFNLDNSSVYDLKGNLLGKVKNLDKVKY